MKEAYRRQKVKRVLATTWWCRLEMCGNGFQHSHSLPFPSIQFPFPPIPIPIFLTYSHSHGIPVWVIPIPSHSHYVIQNLKLYIISDTVIIIICSFRLQSQADGTFSVINYAKHSYIKRTPLSA